jgi:C-terminal processing protease CtpA/Prc
MKCVFASKSTPRHVSLNIMSLLTHCYILVDEYTASASELLTLGLKTYLSNVTVVGRSTYGKGVGQNVFEDKSKKIIVAVTNHFWNVREKNIFNKGISPDVIVQGNDLEAFMEVIKAE